MKIHTTHTSFIFVFFSIILFSCTSSGTSTTTGTTTASGSTGNTSTTRQAADGETDMTGVGNQEKYVSADNKLGREMNMVALVQSNPNLSTLLSLIRASDMLTVLEGPANYTLFAPTNQAFAALPDGTLELLTQPGNQLELTRLLQAHVLPDRITAEEMKDNAQYKTAQGDNVMIKRAGNTIQVGGASILTANVQASNGLVHVVDKVLVPPQR